MDEKLRKKLNHCLLMDHGDIPDIPPQRFEDLRRLPHFLFLNDSEFASTLRGINAGETEGRLYNCANCALAFEMVMRGYDVKARPVPDGTNVGDIDHYVVGSNFFHFPYAMSNSLMHTYEIANNHRHQFWAMKRKHGHEDKRWRVNRKLRVSLERYFDTLDEERENLFEDVCSFMSNHRDWFGSRGIVVVGIMRDMNPAETPRIYHAINYAFFQGEIRFYDTQSRKHVQDLAPFRYINPHEVYIMRTDDKEISPDIVECVYSE